MHLNKSDIRRSMLDLQLLSQSGSSHDKCDCTVPEVSHLVLSEQCTFFLSAITLFDQLIGL